EKDYATLVTEKQKYLSNYGIGQLEEKLNPLLFKRVHRSSMINVNYIQEIFKYAAAYDVRMTNGDIVKVSRSYLEVIRDLTF
ncbi:MAG: LytTR family DNA-binding domain-containing protein, partial [Bacteroidota bacterium]